MYVLTHHLSFYLNYARRNAKKRILRAAILNFKMAALGAMGKNVTNPGFVPWGIRIRKNVGYKNVYENSESRPYPTFCRTLKSGHPF